MTVADICQAEIDALLRTEATVRGVLVSTIDGFCVAANVREPLSPDRISAMMSSLLALGNAMSVETNCGECRDITVDAMSGRLLLMDIPAVDHRMVLTVQCDRDATLGQVLWAARACREQIAGKLQGQAPS